MRYLIPTGVVLFLGLLVHTGDAGDKKKAESTPWAQVNVGGEIRDLLPLRTKVNALVLLDRDIPLATIPSQWRGPLPEAKLEAKGTAHVRSMQVGASAWVVALLDPADKEVDAVLPKLKAPESGGLRVVLSGILAPVKDGDPFVVHANAFGRMRLVDKTDKGQPAMGDIEVAGQAMSGKFEIGKGKFTSLAIQNGPSPILVTGKVVEQVAQPEGKTLHVLGKLILSKGGPLVVDAQVLAAGKDAPSKTSGGRRD